MIEYMPQLPVLAALKNMYETAHIPVALLDNALSLVWCSEAALKRLPSVGRAGGITELLGGRDPVQICAEIAATGSFRTPESADNLFAKQPVILFAAPHECGEYYLLQPCEHLRSGSGLFPDGFARPLSSLESNLRTPLSGIFSAVTMVAKQLQASDPESPMFSYLSAVHQNAYLLLRTNQMLTRYIRLANGLVTLEPVEVDLYDYLFRFLWQARELIEPTGIGFHWLLPEGSLHTRFDLSCLSDLLLCLLSNACRFTREGNEIHLKIRLIQNRLEIVITDRGIGIAPEILPHVFEPYYSYSPDGSACAGNGLGLAVAQKLAVLLGGSLRLASQPGKGTTVVFSGALPALGEPSLLLRSPETPYAQDRFSTLRILLADSIRYPLL